MYGATDRPDFIGMEAGQDDTVGVIGVWTGKGELTGLLVNVVCPSQVMEATYVVTADMFGEMRRLLRPGGLLLCDNAFFHGSVVDPNDHSPPVEGVRAFNRLAATDPRVVSAVIPIRDGVVIGVKVAR